MLLQNGIASTHCQSCIVIANRLISELYNLIITRRSTCISEVLPPRELLKGNTIIKYSSAKNLHSCVTANHSKLSQPNKNLVEITTSSESVASIPKSSVDCPVTSGENLNGKF